VNIWRILPIHYATNKPLVQKLETNKFEYVCVNVLYIWIFTREEEKHLHFFSASNSSFIIVVVKFRWINKSIGQQQT